MKQSIDDYLDYCAAFGRTAQTIKVYRFRLHYFRVFMWRHRVRSLRGVTADHLRQYHNDLVDRSLSATTQQAYLAAVKGMLSWAHRQGLTLTNLGEAVTLPRSPRKLPPTPLTVADMVRLLDNMPNRSITDKRNRAIVEVFYACGLRRAELLGLNVGDLDAKKATLFIKGKGDKERIVPIHNQALEVLAVYLTQRSTTAAGGGRLPPNAPMFTTHSSGKAARCRRLDESGLKQIFRRIRQSSPGTKHVYPHLLRHTCAVHLLHGGADIRHVQVLLGHESPETTSMYLGLVKNNLKQVYDRGIEAILSEAG